MKYLITINFDRKVDAILVAKMIANLLSICITEKGNATTKKRFLDIIRILTDSAVSFEGCVASKTFLLTFILGEKYTSKT